MDEMVKRRLVGAAVLAALASMLLPLLFGNPKDPRSSIQASFSGTPLPGPERATPRPTSRPAPAAARATPRPTARPTARPTPRPTAAPQPAARATPTPPPASGWILQLASYRQQPAAEAFLGRLRQDGYQAYRETVTIKGRTYHRVRLGLSMSRREAEQLQQSLEKRYRLQAQLLAAR